MSPSPSHPESLHLLDVASAAAALRNGATTSSALTRALLDRIDALNPRLNAFVTVTHERALEDAARADAELAGGQSRGPLHGIPIALKDLIDTAGIPTSAGSGIYRGRVPERDATVAARLREAGAVLLGKTNTHELAFGITTNNPHFGATKNPWDPARIPGGSSGGSAAAVAAGMALASIGTDTGGSIRIPAALCGVVGLKPTFGVVPTTGIAPMSFLGDHVGVIARTAGDAATVLSVIAGDDPGDANALPVTLPSFTDALATPHVRGLRVGVPRSPMWRFAEPGVVTQIGSALEVLRELGAELVDIELPDPMSALGLPGTLGYFSVVLEESREAHRAAREADPGGLGPDLAALYDMPEFTGPMIARALAATREYAIAVRRTLAAVDLIASPTVPVVAPPIGDETVDVHGTPVPFIAVGLSNTAPFNIARVPAISVPCGLAGGLPVGLQLAGRPLAEATVLRAANAFLLRSPAPRPA